MPKSKKQKSVQKVKTTQLEKEKVSAQYVEFSDEFVEKVKSNRRPLLRKKVAARLIQEFGKEGKVHIGANYRKLVDLIKVKNDS